MPITSDTEVKLTEQLPAVVDGSDFSTTSMGPTSSSPELNRMEVVPPGVDVGSNGLNNGSPKKSLQVSIPPSTLPDASPVDAPCPTADGPALTLESASSVLAASHPISQPVTGIAAQLSPSHAFNPSNSFARYSSKLVGKRLLIVDQYRSALALQELTSMWGMQVTVMHSCAAWELEWNDIVRQTQLAQKYRHNKVTAVEKVPPQTCPRPYSGHRTSFSYDATAHSVPLTTPTNALVEGAGPVPPLYDIVLILDSMCDTNFAPYALYNEAVLHDQLKLARSSTGPHDQVATAPLPPMHPLRVDSIISTTSSSVPSSLESSIPYELPTSTCTTRRTTPITPSRRSSMSDLSEIETMQMNTSSMTPFTPLPSTASIVHALTRAPIISNLHESISQPPTLIGAHSDGVSTQILSSATTGPILSSSFAPSSPPSSAPPCLPAFVMLLSLTQRNSRLDAAKEASGRGFAGVVMKPAKWKSLLQALVRATKYKPSGTVLHRAAAVFGAASPFCHISPILKPNTPTPKNASTAVHTNTNTGPGSALMSVVEGDGAEAVTPSVGPTPSDQTILKSMIDSSSENKGLSAASRLLVEVPERGTSHRRSLSPLFQPSSTSSTTSTISTSSVLSNGSSTSSASPAIFPHPPLADLGEFRLPDPARAHLAPINLSSIIQTPSAVPLNRHQSTPIHLPMGQSSVDTPMSGNSFAGHYYSASSTPITQSPAGLNPTRAALNFGSPITPGTGTSASSTSIALHANNPSLTPTLTPMKSISLLPPQTPTPTSNSTNRRSSVKRLSNVAAPPNPALRILVTEDNVLNQKVVVRMLNHLGYHDITIANDGIECLQWMSKMNQHHPSSHQSGANKKASPGQSQANSAAQNRPFDLIMMDLQM